MGAVEDFLSPKNGASFDPFDEDEMKKGYCKIMSMSDDEMDAAGQLSAQIAKASDQNLFVQSVCKLAGIVS